MESVSPKKNNIFFWRVLLYMIPVRLKLVERGVDLDSVLCPMCLTAQENINHIFLHYKVAKQSWRCIVLWVDVDIPFFTSLGEMMEWVDSRPVARMKRVIINSIFLVNI